MIGMEWLLDVLLVVLLTATLFHAIRLERALGVLKRDRAALEELVASFNASTHAAETGVERLHAAADGSGRQIQRQIDAAITLKDDLTFLVQRGEGLADRLDEGVRAARPPFAVAGQTAARTAYASQMPPVQTLPGQPGPSRNMASEIGASPVGVVPIGVAQIDSRRTGTAQFGTTQIGAPQTGPFQTGPSQTGPSQTGPSQTGPSQTGPYPTAISPERAARDAEPKLRSQAERDLLKALRMVR